MKHTKHILGYEDFVNESAVTEAAGLPSHARNLSRKLKAHWLPDTDSNGIYFLADGPDRYRTNKGQTITIDLSVRTGEYTVIDKKDDVIYQGGDPYTVAKLIESVNEAKKVKVIGSLGNFKVFNNSKDGDHIILIVGSGSDQKEHPVSLKKSDTPEKLRKRFYVGKEMKIDESINEDLTFVYDGVQINNPFMDDGGIGKPVVPAQYYGRDYTKAPISTVVNAMEHLVRYYEDWKLSENGTFDGTVGDKLEEAYKAYKKAK
jgi:hypothetical protein